MHSKQLRSAPNAIRNIFCGERKGRLAHVIGEASRRCRMILPACSILLADAVLLANVVELWARFT